jgi:BCD family chlorophyll transporter-like MFS transporter
MAEHDRLGHALNVPATGYIFVYGIEVVMLCATLIALAPLVRRIAPVAALSR